MFWPFWPLLLHPRLRQRLQELPWSVSTLQKRRRPCGRRAARHESERFEEAGEASADWERARGAQSESERPTLFWLIEPESRRLFLLFSGANLRREDSHRRSRLDPSRLLAT